MKKHANVASSELESCSRIVRQISTVLFVVALTEAVPTVAQQTTPVVPPPVPPGAAFALWSRIDTGALVENRPESLPRTECTNATPCPTLEGIDATLPTCQYAFQSNATDHNPSKVEAVYYGYVGDDVEYVGSGSIPANTWYTFMCSESEVLQRGYRIVSSAFDPAYRAASQEPVGVALATYRCLVKVGGKWYVRPTCTAK